MENSVFNFAKKSLKSGSYLEQLAYEYCEEDGYAEFEEILEDVGEPVEIHFDADYYFGMEGTIPGYSDIPIKPGNDILTSDIMDNLSYFDCNNDIQVYSGNGAYIIEAISNSEETYLSSTFESRGERFVEKGGELHNVPSNHEVGLYVSNYFTTERVKESTSRHYVSPDTISSQFNRYHVIINGMGYDVFSSPHRSTIYLERSECGIKTTLGYFDEGPYQEFINYRMGDVLVVNCDTNRVVCLLTSQDTQWHRCIDKVPVSLASFREFLQRIRKPLNPIPVGIMNYQRVYGDDNFFFNKRISFLSARVGRGGHILKYFEKTSSLLLIVLRLMGFIVYDNKLYATSVSQCNHGYLDDVYRFFYRKWRSRYESYRDRIMDRHDDVF
jgi:hypothetical protein